MTGKILQVADSLFKRALAMGSLNNSYGVEALSQLANFVYEMTMERKESDGKYACEVIEKDESKLVDVK